MDSSVLTVFLTVTASNVALICSNCLRSRSMRSRSYRALSMLDTEFCTVAFFTFSGLK